MMRANYNDLDDGDDAQHKQLRTAVRNAQTAYESAEQIYELTKDAVHNDAIKVAKASLGRRPPPLRRRPSSSNTPASPPRSTA